MTTLNEFIEEAMEKIETIDPSYEYAADYGGFAGLLDAKLFEATDTLERGLRFAANPDQAHAVQNVMADIKSTPWAKMASGGGEAKVLGLLDQVYANLSACLEV